MSKEKTRLFTSESVTEGHPDKMCDQISDAILDAIISRDKDARVACETAVCTGMVFVMGEISTSCYVDIQSIVRDTVREIGYTRAKFGFDADTCAVLTSINEQSPDIAMGVDNSSEYKADGSDAADRIGAGDQGMMFGYACNETKELMPLPIMLAHKLTRRLTDVRKDGVLDYLLPDGKSQVTVEYVDGKAARVDTVVVSTQHTANVTTEKLRADVKEKVILPVIPPEFIDEKTKFIINPTGRFEIGGPYGDSGLTGRKIIVDTYGGYCPHGGGAFSGKDPTKVDRSAAYMMRYICKNIVAAGLADKIEAEVSYAIGVAHPVSLCVDTFGTGRISDDDMRALITETFDLRPKAIIDKLGLLAPIYKKTAAYGHFGREGFPWEETDMVKILLQNAEKYLK
ncbi:MAG TPA: methionine adenosyltransferase [Firmicutes bacterium]|nr:methionine adenosyltransferase [Bacillota bacterium]